MPEPRLFAEVPLATADELLDVLAPHHGRELWDRPDTDWIFRGQGESAWTLRPSALRPGALDAYLGPNFTPPSTPEEHREAELRAVMGFASRATERGYEIPGDSHEIRDWDSPPTVTGFDAFPPSRYRAIFGLAQHYGIPTRLLDWTVNPLAGAYFAAKPIAQRLRRGAESAPEGDGRFAVWALAYWFLVHHCRWWAPGAVPVTVPASSNPNLTAQRGAFTLVRFKGMNLPERLPPDLDALFIDPAYGVPLAEVDTPRVDKPGAGRVEGCS